jgi:N-formylmaleamate deformylase
MTDSDGRVYTQRALADLAEVPATSRWVRTPSVLLHLLDYGTSEEIRRLPPMVVAPGITTPAVGMDFVVRRLTHLVRPLVLDVRGRGLSDSAHDFTLEAYAEDLLATVEQLDLPAPLLMGHSMGARIVGRAAVLGDSRVRGSILVDPPLSGPDRAPYPTSEEAFIGQLRAARRGVTADEVAQSWPGWPARELQLRARWLATCQEEAVTATHHGFESEDFFPHWRAVPAPAVFIYGERSPVVTADGLSEARSANPAATFLGVADAGHMVFWDQPEAAVDILEMALVDLIEGTASTP